MKRLHEFFKHERQTVFEPDAYFVQRVMARLNRKAEDIGIWEMVPSSSRPVLVLALVLLLCFIALDEFVPVMPERGLISAVLESEQGPVEAQVLSETEDADQDFIQELIAMEGDQ
jgi:hypothetical protein